MKDEILPKVATEGTFDLSQNVLPLSQNVEEREPEGEANNIFMVVVNKISKMDGVTNAFAFI